MGVPDADGGDVLGLEELVSPSRLPLQEVKWGRTMRPARVRDAVRNTVADIGAGKVHGGPCDTPT